MCFSRSLSLARSLARSLVVQAAVQLRVHEIRLLFSSLATGGGEDDTNAAAMAITNTIFDASIVVWSRKAAERTFLLLSASTFKKKE